MALIRIARPGESTRFVDVGPAHGRVYGQPGRAWAISDGSGPATGNPTMPTPEKDRIRNAANRAKRKAAALPPRCTKYLRSGEACGRAKGHGHACRSRAFMDRQAAAIRSTK